MDEFIELPADCLSVQLVCCHLGLERDILMYTNAERRKLRLFKVMSNWSKIKAITLMFLFECISLLMLNMSDMFNMRREMHSNKKYMKGRYVMA